MDNKEKNFISAVIYVHNAKEHIAAFMHMLITVLEANFEHSEIICVNDSSEDESLQLIRESAKSANVTNISVLNMSYFHGLELAMNAGVDLSIGDFVLEFDTTALDYEPEEIMCVYRRALEGYDIVSASPDKRQKFTSNLFYFIFDKFTDLSHKMYSETFRILSRRVINRVSSMNKTVPYRKAVYAHCGLKTDNMVYQQTDGIANRQNDIQEKKYRRRLAVDVLILFTDMGYRFSMSMTFLMMLMAFAIAVYSVVIYIIGNPVEGWTTTILFLSFSFFGLFGILTIIIKYLQILIDLVFRRKRYSFEGIEKLTR